MKWKRRCYNQNVARSLARLPPKVHLIFIDRLLDKDETILYSKTRELGREPNAVWLNIQDKRIALGRSGEKWDGNRGVETELVRLYLYCLLWDKETIYPAVMPLIMTVIIIWC